MRLLQNIREGMHVRVDYIQSGGSRNQLNSVEPVGPDAEAGVSPTAANRPASHARPARGAAGRRSGPEAGGTRTHNARAAGREALLHQQRRLAAAALVIASPATSLRSSSGIGSSRSPVSLAAGARRKVACSIGWPGHPTKVGSTPLSPGYTVPRNSVEVLGGRIQPQQVLINLTVNASMPWTPVSQQHGHGAVDPRGAQRDSSGR
jgi:hypothetical protein